MNIEAKPDKPKDLVSLAEALKVAMKSSNPPEQSHVLPAFAPCRVDGKFGTG